LRREGLTPLLFLTEGVGGMSSIWHLIELTLAPKEYPCPSAGLPLVGVAPMGGIPCSPKVFRRASLEKRGTDMIFFLICYK